MTSTLTGFGLLKVSGRDAKRLLQGQLTCDVELAHDQAGLLGAQCNPQGRILSLFHLFRLADTYYLLMPRPLVALAHAALKKYSVFYQVNLEDGSEELANLEPVQTALMKQFPITDQASFHYRLFAAHIPCIYPETSGKFLPHDLHLHLLNGISFNKGCYTGQEIIARMHYKAILKKHLYRTQLLSNTPPLPGSMLYAQIENEKKPSGEVVDVYSPAYNHHYALIITDAAHAKDNHLFLESDPHTFFTFFPH